MNRRYFVLDKASTPWPLSSRCWLVSWSTVAKAFVYILLEKTKTFFMYRGNSLQKEAILSCSRNRVTISFEKKLRSSAERRPFFSFPWLLKSARTHLDLWGPWQYDSSTWYCNRGRQTTLSRWISWLGIK